MLSVRGQPIESQKSIWLQIDNDDPTNIDELGHGQYIRSPADVIQYAKRPLVLAIYGAWGSGETSVMLQIRQRLEAARDTILVASLGWGHGAPRR